MALKDLTYIQTRLEKLLLFPMHISGQPPTGLDISPWDNFTLTISHQDNSPLGRFTHRTGGELSRWGFVLGELSWWGIVLAGVVLVESCPGGELGSFTMGICFEGVVLVGTCLSGELFR